MHDLTFTILINYLYYNTYILININLLFLSHKYSLLATNLDKSNHQYLHYKLLSKIIFITHFLVYNSQQSNFYILIIKLILFFSLVIIKFPQDTLFILFTFHLNLCFLIPIVLSVTKIILFFWFYLPLLLFNYYISIPFL